MRKTLLLLCSMLICLTISVQAQTRVTGVVTSSKDGLPVAANVHIKGSTRGVSASTNGTYTLENVAKDAVLIFSSVGFQRIEVPVNGRSTINIPLQSAEQDLDEVIVVAYGTAKKVATRGLLQSLKVVTLKTSQPFLSKMH